MIIRVILFMVLIFSFKVDFAQKSDRDYASSLISHEKTLIDSSAYNKWSSVDGAQITNDGKYATYVIHHDSIYDYTLVLKEINGSWGMRVPNVWGARFTSDSRMALFTIKDTLYISELGGTYLCRIPKVKSFDIPTEGSGNWVAFRTDSINDLVVLDIRSGEKRICKSIKSFFFSEDGGSLIALKEEAIMDSMCQSIDLIDLATGNLVEVWRGNGFERMILNSSASQIVFMLSGSKEANKSVYYFHKGNRIPILLLNNDEIAKDSSIILSELLRVSNDGKYVFFTAKRINGMIDKKRDSSSVNIWSYLDEKLQPMQLEDLGQNSEYTYAINIRNKRIILLSGENESILGFSKNDEVCLIQHIVGSSDALEGNWNTTSQRSYSLKSIVKDRDVLLDVKGFQLVELSPEGKYVIFYDNELSNYFSYEKVTGIYRNLTAGINTSWLRSYRDDLSKWPRGICGWLSNDAAVFICDKFDIWKIDPSGKKNPINLTNGYGVKHNTIFYPALSEQKAEIFPEDEPIVLNSFNIVNMKNGFFRKEINLPGDPQELMTGNYIYKLFKNPYVRNAGILPVKARDENTFIVLRMKATESPNYFITSNFEKFTPLSNVYPEKAFNWYTTELHTWRKADGREARGVLFKPQNFDSLKRYPVIFYYYEKKSFGLNEYILPNDITGGCDINIPTYVSNGYLVFSPDIDYSIGDPMQGAFDAITSAAYYVSGLPFVRKDKMGIGGCSFGGIQTNYLVTHTNLFAAAYSASSMSDFVSAYNDMPMRSRSLQFFFEKGGQGRMGGTLWERPDMYIKNSPIFNADKVNTPLLLMHTTNDGICSFSQAVEFFTALRRLGKKAWLLEYTEGDHTLSGVSAVDYGVRLRQFFDHYLKDLPAPYWMTRGGEAKMRRMDNGYKLDYIIKTPGKGLLIESSNR